MTIEQLHSKLAEETRCYQAWARRIEIGYVLGSTKTAKRWEAKIERLSERLDAAVAKAQAVSQT